MIDCSPFYLFYFNFLQHGKLSHSEVNAWMENNMYSGTTRSDSYFDSQVCFSRDTLVICNSRLMASEMTPVTCFGASSQHLF